VLAFAAVLPKLNSMTRTPIKLALIAGALLVLGALALPALRAAENRKGNTSQEEQKKRGDDALRKYDKNGNGKLDPDEEAAMKADEEKAKRKKK